MVGVSDINTDDGPPEQYHALTRSQRDHLLATHHHGHSPSGQDIQRTIRDLRGGDRPGNTTTYSVLDDLTSWGLLEAEVVDGKTNGYHVTPRGRRLLVDARGLFPGDSNE